LAIYAADIQINVKNKGELRTLESRFKKIETAAVSLNKTLKGLGRRNAIKVDTRAAMSAISALEARIRGLNRTVNLDARTSASGRDGGGMSGAAMPILATAFSSRLGGSGGSRGGRSVRFRGSGLGRQDNERLGIESAARNARLDELQNSLNQNQKVFDDANAVLKETEKSIDTLEKARKQKFDEYLGAKKVREDLKSRGGPIFPKVRQQIKDQQKLVTELYKQEDALGDQLKTAKGLKEVQEGTLNSAEKQLNQSQKNLKIFEDQKEAAKVTKAVLTDPKQLKLQEALSKAIVKQQDVQMKLGQNKEKLVDLTAQEKKLAGDLNRLKGRGFDRENQSFRNTADQLSVVRRQITNTTKAIEGGTSKSGKTVVTGLNNDLIEAAKLIDKADKELQAFKVTAAKPVQGGFLQQIQTGFKGLGAKGALGSMGKGMAGASALIPGVAPFALGAGIGQAGKTGGQAVAGGIMGAVGAGAIMGTLAFLEFAKSATVVASEMERMRTALSGVVPDQESYNTAIEKVTTLSKKYGISQRTLLKGFTQLQASADAAGFSVDETGNLMEGLLARTLASGKGLEEFKGVLLASSQILSKGKLQAEEARGQIGERIPGFMADLAASMKIEMKELDKMMEQGEVTLEHFFKLGEDLLKNNEKIAVRMAQSYANAGQRLTTAMENLQAAMGPGLSIAGAKWQDFTTGIIDGLTEMAKSANAKEIDRLTKVLDRINKGGIDGKIMESIHGSPEKIKEEIEILDGTKIINERLRRQKAAQAEEEDKNWRKLKKRLEIDLKYQQDRITLGEEEAELQRELAEIKLQFSDRKDIQEIDDLIRKIEKATKAADEASTVFKDWLDALEERLKTLKDPMYQLTTLVDAAGDSFQDSFKDVIKGTKSVGDAFVDMFNRIADAYLDMVAETIAAQAKAGFIKFVASIITPNLGGGGGGSGFNANAPDMGYGPGPSAVPGLDFRMATGGFVDRPTNALIGEASGEYVIPEHKMSESMSRYQAGVRGKAVIPGSSAAESGGVSGSEIVVSYTGPTLNFNGDDYVPRSAVPEIINSAAKRGARAGEAKVFNNLKNSRSHRARIGL